MFDLVCRRSGSRVGGSLERKLLAGCLPSFPTTVKPCMHQRKPGCVVTRIHQRQMFIASDVWWNLELVTHTQCWQWWRPRLVWEPWERPLRNLAACVGNGPTRTASHADWMLEHLSRCAPHVMEPKLYVPNAWQPTGHGKWAMQSTQHVCMGVIQCLKSTVTTMSLGSTSNAGHRCRLMWKIWRTWLDLVVMALSMPRRSLQGCKRQWMLVMEHNENLWYGHGSCRSNSRYECCLWHGAGNCSSTDMFGERLLSEFWRQPADQRLAALASDHVVYEKGLNLIAASRLLEIFQIHVWCQLGFHWFWWCCLWSGFFICFEDLVLCWEFPQSRMHQLWIVVLLLYRLIYIYTHSGWAHRPRYHHISDGFIANYLIYIYMDITVISSDSHKLPRVRDSHQHVRSHSR